MLVLSRKLGEKIVIDGDICVTVVAIQGNRVRLGITAPASICVDREEVQQRLEVIHPCGPALPVLQVPHGENPW